MVATLVLVLYICFLRSSQGFDVADALARHRRHRVGVQRHEASDGGAKRQPTDAFGRRQGFTAPLRDADHPAPPPRATIVLWLDESFWGHPGVYDCGAAGTCELTRDRSRLHEPGTHAVWFYGPNVADTVDAVAADLAAAGGGATNTANAKKKQKDGPQAARLPLPRHPRHQWILENDESPCFYGRMLAVAPFLRLFNHSATFDASSTWPLWPGPAQPA